MNGPVRSMAWSPDGKSLALSRENGKLTLEFGSTSWKKKLGKAFRYMVKRPHQTNISGRPSNKTLFYAVLSAGLSTAPKSFWVPAKRWRSAAWRTGPFW